VKFTARHTEAGQNVNARFPVVISISKTNPRCMAQEPGAARGRAAAARAHYRNQ